MPNPLHALGYRILTASLRRDSAEPESSSPLSRRGFMLMAATLTSCAVAAPLTSQAEGASSASASSKTRAKTKSKAKAKPTPPPEDSTPLSDGPVPRNPDMTFSSDFVNCAGVPFSQVQVSGKYIAMTFDDGPHPTNTPRLLEILRARNIKATFFVIGQSAALYPQVLRNTVAEGHEIGNHSHTHRLLSKASDAELRLELSRCRDAVVSATGAPPRVLRPPYGGLLKRQRELVRSEFGYPIILWSVDPLDWRRPGPSVVASRILHGTGAGGIVLAHDLHSQTVDAMPATLDGLLRRGFQFVTVSQLLAMKTDAANTQASATPNHS